MVSTGDDEAATFQMAQTEEPPSASALSNRATPPLQPGERYDVGGVIGRGGMGEVLSALDEQIGREVAIKRLHVPRPTAAQLALFLREARIQGRLQHPAIPPVHEIATDPSGRPYFVMKRLSGVTLADVFRDRAAHPTLTKQRLLRDFVEVCLAVELAHAHRIVHRDLKPSNILLGELGEVYVIDWGIARELNTPDLPQGLVLGTPGYMPPEQARGDADLDERADVYALGCVLFEILTGRRPTPDEVSAVSASDDVPVELEAICRSATSFDRGTRLGSARELAAAVQRFLDGDRDHERRREIAARHLEAARDAMARSGDEVERRQHAMREAGRALALDPTLGGAAQLVGRLMLEPPVTTPAAVRDELDAIDRSDDERQLRMMAVVNAVHVAIIPLAIVLGIRDVFYLTSLGCLPLLNIGLQICAVRSEKLKRWCAPLAGICAMLLLAFMARVFTPFLFAPGYAAISLMAFALSSQARDRRVVGTITLSSVAAILGVWGAEATGLISRTMWTYGGTLVLRSPLDGIDSFPIVPALCFYVVFLIGSSASVSYAVSRMQRRSREQLQIQSWQLRQLL
jgi:serine/threonine-protein kinase